MTWVVPRVLEQTQGAASISAIDAFQDPTVYGVTSKTGTLLGTPIELLYPVCAANAPETYVRAPNCHFLKLGSNIFKDTSWISSNDAGPRA